VSLPIEQWRPIPGYEGYYEASDQGRIRSVTRSVRYDNGRSRVYRGQVLKPQLGPHGRYTVRVSRQNKSRCFTVASLVLAAFRGPRPPGMECCHNDGNSTNDRADNLRWDTPSENSYDRVRHGTHASARKTHCPRDHALAPPNLIGPGKKTKRRCRACRAAVGVGAARLAGAGRARRRGRRPGHPGTGPAWSASLSRGSRGASPSGAPTKLKQQEKLAEKMARQLEHPLKDPRSGGDRRQQERRRDGDPETLTERMRAAGIMHDRRQGDRRQKDRRT
jgi:hypothetical protein